MVALLAEGVDRNSLLPRSQEEYGWSPSSRRAWIEIRMSRIMPGALQVALLAEGVDRNAIISATTINSYKSPSSRRAWIEITWGSSSGIMILSRPPRGGRG